MNVGGSYGKTPNYEPTAFAGPKEGGSAYAIHGSPVMGPIGRYQYTHPNTNYEQPRELFHKVFDDTQRKHCVENIASGLGTVNKEIQTRMLKHFFLVSDEYGTAVGKAIGFSDADMAACKPEK